MKLRNQAGQVLIGTAVAMVVLAGFAGLAIDMGTLRFQKRIEQTAADAAALAGASNLNYSTTSWLPGAQNAAIQNGFTDGSSNSLTSCEGGASVGTTCVQVLNGPADVTFNGATILGGKHSGNTAYVEVLVAKVQPTYFMTIFGHTSETIVTRAVATNTGGGAAGGGGCIYTLGTPTKQLNFNKAGIGSTGTNYVYAPTCGIVDNGNFVANGNVSVKAGSIGVGGGVNIPNNSTPDCTQAHPAGVCPTPVANSISYSGDPFASKYSTPVASGIGSSSTTNGVTTFTPGTYTDLTVNSGTNALFQPGVYDITGTFKINGGSFVCGGGIASFSAGSMTCTQDAAGDGVTFHMEGANASIQVNGTSTTQMYAPNSGPYEGLLVYQDAVDTHQATINGNDGSLWQGAIYMPSADLDFSGTSSFNNGAAYTVIVVDQLLISGGAYVNLNSNYSGLANNGGPLSGVTQWATLVE